jgi:DUF917 family protein
MTRASNDEIVDRALRGSCSEMGSRVGMAARPTTGSRVQEFGVLNTCSLAWRIGRCIKFAQITNKVSSVAEALVVELGGSDAAKVLFQGKIISVERRLHKGHSHGEVVIASTPSEPEHQRPAAQGGELRIPFKNENILAEHVRDERREILATVPDLISILDAGSGKGLGVPEYRYGLQVVVLGLVSSPRWVDTPFGLSIGGPKAFGFDTEYRPLGVYRQPDSVIEEFAPRREIMPST